MECLEKYRARLIFALVTVLALPCMIACQPVECKGCKNGSKTGTFCSTQTQCNFCYDIDSDGKRVLCQSAVDAGCKDPNCYWGIDVAFYMTGPFYTFDALGNPGQISTFGYQQIHKVTVTENKAAKPNTTVTMSERILANSHNVAMNIFQGPRTTNELGYFFDYLGIGSNTNTLPDDLQVIMKQSFFKDCLQVNKYWYYGNTSVVEGEPP